VSLKDEKCGDRKRKTPNRRAERIASLPVTRNRRRAAFSSQVLQRFLSWRSDPIDKCPPAAFAVIGNEVNGKYYEEEAAR